VCDKFICIQISRAKGERIFGGLELIAIRETGRINDNTVLIDFGMLGLADLGAVYLLEGEETLLIDCGTRVDAPNIVKALRMLNSFPPDIVVFTHISIIAKESIIYARKPKWKGLMSK